MRFQKLGLLSFVALAAFSGFGSGFALYEPSVISHALGGALVGKAMDASANFNNPATLTDLTNLWVTVGFVTEHPRGELRGTTDGQSWGADQGMNPGLFWLPHFQLAVPLPWDFAFGFSAGVEYGLGSKYNNGWPLDWNANETTVQGYVLNPNLAYKVTDKWSVAVGLRWLYFDFEQYKHPSGGSEIYRSGIPVPLGSYYQQSEYRLQGDNRWRSLGWVVGTKYDILDNVSVGIVYKSAIETTVKGSTSMNNQALSVTPYYPALASETVLRQGVLQNLNSYNGSAEADMTLPQSVSGGINWDVTEKHHLGLAVSWTEWSVFDTLMFKVQPQTNPVYLNWNDTWRASVGYAWDFAADWTWMISYVFDQDCCLNKDQASAMLPPAHRNIATTGFKWNIWRNMDVALDYSCIFMDGGSFNTQYGGHTYHVETCRGFCHAVGFNVSYRF